MTDLRDRRVLVIGASAGIGRAVALEAAGAGASVSAVARRADRLAELTADQRGIRALAVDVTDADDVARMVTEAAADGPFDLVVYAAGVATIRRLADVDEAEWRRTIETNLLGFQRIVQRLVAGGLAEGALVVALSSETVGEPRLAMVPYAVSKAALEESLRGWRVEHPEVRFCTVTVGATQPTEFGSEFDLEVLGPVLGEWMRRGQLPSVYMETAELARVVVALAAALLANPGVGIEHLLVRSPSAPLGDLSAMGL
jgi:NAD(P)-dependent dehydrogenase (short-subunit alcohol dehydrogenase family)